MQMRKHCCEDIVSLNVSPFSRTGSMRKKVSELFQKHFVSATMFPGMRSLRARNSFVASRQGDGPLVTARITSRHNRVSWVGKGSERLGTRLYKKGLDN